MFTATPVYSSVPAVAPIADGCARAADAHELGEAIAALAARLHAATYELLTLLLEFDARAGWNNGFLSCAHWLHWRTGIDLGAAREKVRVAKALPALPHISASMQRGRLSYTKVRALTRVATSENEVALLDVALAGTAAHVERFVRAWRRVDRVEQARQDETRHLNRQVSTWLDDDGMIVIRGRLTPEVGAVVQRALEAAADRLFRDAAGASTGDAMAEDLTPAQRRADALGLLSECALAADLDRGTRGDCYQVVLHVNAESTTMDTALASSAGTGPEGSTRSSCAGPRVFEGVIEVDHGAQYVSAETSRRLSCDAAVVRMDHDATGAVLSVSRKTRTIPPTIRRALGARDTSCRFPGCTSRRCDAHHVEHWADGGPTSLDNLLRLCRRHHRAVHEGGFAVRRFSNGALVFFRPDGTSLDAAPSLPDWRLAAPEASTCATGMPPTWDGTRFDVAWALDVLRARSASCATHRLPA